LGTARFKQFGRAVRAIPIWLLAQTAVVLCLLPTPRSLVSAVAVVAIAAPASAHHSLAIFDQSKVNYLTGTVKQFSNNPHAGCIS
jgi:hypothetical protein